MIDQTIIEISKQIETLQTQWLGMMQYLLPLLFGISGSLIAGVIMITSYSDNYRIIGLVCLLVGVIGVVYLYEFNSDIDKITKWKNSLIEGRQQLIKTNIQKLDCEELRLDILFIMENKTSPDYIIKEFDYEKDYYYHKCEIPLRDEVMKLQREN